MLKGKLAKNLHNLVGRETKIDTFSKIAKVTLVQLGGVYDVELSGGQTMNSISCSTNSKCYVDQWVTLEFFGGNWVIVGDAAQRGGS